MFSVVFPVNLVLRIARIFAQNQFNRPIGRLVTLPLAHHARGGASRTGGGRCRRRRRFGARHVAVCEIRRRFRLLVPIRSGVEFGWSAAEWMYAPKFQRTAVFLARESDHLVGGREDWIDMLSRSVGSAVPEEFGKFELADVMLVVCF